MSTKHFSPIGPAVWPAIRTCNIYIYIRKYICNNYISDILNEDYSSVLFRYKLFRVFNTLYICVFDLFIHIQYTSKNLNLTCFLKNRYLNLKLFENYIIHTTSNIFYYKLLMCFFYYNLSLAILSLYMNYQIL